MSPTCLYRSPNQTADERNVFLSGPEQIGSSIALQSPICSFVIGDLNAKCTHWWPEGTSNACGLELHNISSLLGYSQIINEPTNLEPNKSPSCIDLIFASQPNLVVEGGIYPSLTNTCHHQIIHAKVSFKIHLPSPYEREVWHYNRAQVHLIKRSIDRPLTGPGPLKTSVLMTKWNVLMKLCLIFLGTLFHTKQLNVAIKIRLG